MEDHVPKDCGWAWMTVAGAAWCMFCVVASFKSQGILFVEFIKAFDASDALTAWMMGVTACGMSLLSPVATYLANRYTSRHVIAFGTILCAISALLTAFAPNIYFVISIYGILTGIGYACLYGPSLMMIGIYFVKRRTLATGLALSGASVGQLVIPVMMATLIELYTIWGALLVYSAFLLHGLVFAMLMRPVSFYQKKKYVHRRDSSHNDGLICTEQQILDVNQDSSQKSLSASNGSCNAAGDSFISHKYGKSNTNNSMQPAKQDSENMHLEEKCDGNTYETEGMKATSHNYSITRRCWYSVTKLYHWDHFKNGLYLIYLGACVIGNSAYVDHSLYIPPFAVSIGISKDVASYLLAIVGIGDFFGRILGGWFADLNLIKRSQQMSISMIAIGLTTITCTFIPCFTSLCVMCVVLGFIGGTYVSMYTIVLIDFLGLESFPSAFGLMIMFQGLFNTMLPSLLGLLKDSTGSYSASYFVLGACMIVSGSFLLLEPCVRKYQKNTINRHLKSTECKQQT